MNKTYAELLGGTIGGAGAGGWSMPIFASKNVTITESGTVVISCVGAGGAGASANTANGTATGGNSAPWGRKRVKVSAGDVLTFTLAAGVLSPSTANTNGAAGGVTTIALNGATLMTVAGGEGGIYNGMTAVAAAATAVVTGADFWVPGIRAGSATFGSTYATVSGGAAVDLLATGKGRSPDRTTYNSAVGGSVGTDDGTWMNWIELAAWGLFIADASIATSAMGVPGRGSTRTPAIMAGAFAGGGDNGGSPAGVGAGGGGTLQGGYGAKSGNAYAYITFTPLG